MSLPYTQYFIVEGKYLGQAPRKLVFIHAHLQAPNSYAFFCPICGEVWARCPIQRGDQGYQLTEPTTHWQILHVACRKHYMHAYSVPGGLMLDWDREFSDALPKAALRWELSRHLELYIDVPEVKPSNLSN